MSFKDELINGIKAGYCYYYCQTYEIGKACEEIAEAIKAIECYEAKIWDFNSQPDIDDVIDRFQSDNNVKKPVLIAKNLNWFLKDEYGSFNKELVSMLQSKAEYFSSTNGRRVLIIVSDTDFNSAIPEPLQKDFNILEFELPDADEIKKQYDFIVASVKQSKPEWEAPTAEVESEIILNCRGMTTREIQSGLAYSLVKDKGKLNPKTMAQIRAKGIEKVAGIKITEPTFGFDSLLGLENIKEFVLSTVTHPLSKGILLLGPPGTGKTAFCQALGFEAKRTLFEMEMAQMFGSLVGTTEANIGAAIKVIRANAPNLLAIDEIEKALSGMKGGGESDGGTTKRAMAQFLKFLSEDREGVYTIATCNDISGLPPEWIRAERWDAVFFIDLPNEKEREAILEYYKNIYSVKGELRNSAGFSGAEIKSACRIAAMMGTSIEDATRFIVPLSKTMGPEIDALRSWAKNKTIPASIEIPSKKQSNLRSVSV